MKEIKSIVNAYHSHSERAALATVVRVEGSSYRRTGARMLVFETGVWVGGISGGCLEGDALKRAKMAILKDSPSLVTYDTTTDDDHQIGVGLGCNGIIDVLFAPIDKTDSHNPIKLLEETLHFPEQNHILITITKTPENAKNLLGKIFRYNKAPDLKPLSEYSDLETLAKSIENLEKSKNLFFENGLNIYVELVPKPIKVYILGNQYDLYPLADLVLSLGWDLFIVSEKSKIKEQLKSNVLEDFKPEMLDKNSAILLMSHSLNTDKANLKNTLPLNLPYIGMLGPRVRAEKIWHELQQEGIEVNTQNIFAPVGLDIGATTPDEIALSIVSEIKMVFANRSGEHLRNRPLPIHDREQPMIFK